jgi:hypothetical protein
MKEEGVKAKEERRARRRKAKKEAEQLPGAVGTDSGEV